MVDKSRREITKVLGMSAVCTVPLLTVASLLPSKSSAASLVDPESPQAKALQYVESSARDDQACLLCALYQPLGDGEFGNCPLFPGAEVKAIAWCSAWVPKG